MRMVMEQGSPEEAQIVSLQQRVHTLEERVAVLEEQLRAVLAAPPGQPDQVT
jgi:hypothetical protein